MEGKCDILILTATFGSGHTSVSNAIWEYLKLKAEDIDIKISDIFQIINPEAYKGVYKGYELLIKTNSKIYNHFYYKKNQSDSPQVEDVIYSIYLNRFSDYIISINPRLIISVFPMCSGFVSRFKEKHMSSIPLLTCITDVVDGNEWIYPGTDRYYVAAEDVMEGLVEKGVERNLIRVTGIPVRKEFLECRRDRVILKELGINEDNFVIMMMGGGMGLLPMKMKFYKWMNGLNGVKVLVLTGKNDELYKKLYNHKRLNNIIPLKYVNNVAMLMANSDILVSKAGGITVFEAIAAGIPMVVYKPVLGQEIENGKFVLKQDIGCIARDIDELKEKIYQARFENGYIERMNRNMNVLKKNIDMGTLVDDVLSLYNRRLLEAQ